MKPWDLLRQPSTISVSTSYPADLRNVIATFKVPETELAGLLAWMCSARDADEGGRDEVPGQTSPARDHVFLWEYGIDERFRTVGVGPVSHVAVPFAEWRAWKDAREQVEQAWEELSEQIARSEAPPPIALNFHRCPDRTADGRQDRCGQFSHPRQCTEEWCGRAGCTIAYPIDEVRLPDPDPVLDALLDEEERIARSGAHAPDQPDDTDTELDLAVWSFRMVNRGQYAITRDGSDVAEILFHQRMPGVAAAVPLIAEALATANRGRFVDPRNTPRSQP